MTETAYETMTEGSPAQLTGGNALVGFLQKLVDASPNHRAAVAIGSLATTFDVASPDKPLAVAVSAVHAGDRMCETAIGLAVLWSKWNRRCCLIDLGSGPRNLGGAIRSSSPDLASLSRSAADISSVSLLHSKLPTSGVIAAGNVDPLSLISTGQLGRIINSLKKRFDRVVVAAPSLADGFPFLSLAGSCDRLVLSLRRGRSRGGPVREICEQAMARGLRPIDAIWYE